MSDPPDTGLLAFVAAQLGRTPRDPWRVAARCLHGFPTVIASPPTLADGSRFPTLYWLTCPHLSEAVSAQESAGGGATWARRVEAEPELADAMRAVDDTVRGLRVTEGGGVDSCASVGVAGQRDPLSIKCLHAHVALSLAGIDDPVGVAVIRTAGESCCDARCARLLSAEEESA